FDDAEKYLYNCKPQEELLRLRRRKRSFRSVPLVNRAPVNLTDWPSKSLFVGDTDLLMECKRKIRSAVREDVQECGRRLLGQNFTVPCENEDKIAEIPLDVLLIDNYYSTAVFNLTQDKSICMGTTDPDFAYKLRQCISNVFNKARDYPGWNLFEKRAREYSVSTCNARCLEKLGDCKDSLEETTLALCKCIPDDKRSTYRSMLGDCYPALKENEFILDTLMARDINIVRSHVCITKATDPCS
uniref:Uncharacterized protein n=1 Tax=Romanomermis culicivorax TaxID=13658 RepID=A0A915K625_ROMCU